VTSLQTATLPKAIDVGDAFSAAIVAPSPARATIIEGSTASLAIVMVPVAGVFAVGLKTTLILLLCPALNASGRCGPDAVNSEPDTEIPEIIRIPVPLFVSVTDFVLV